MIGSMIDYFSSNAVYHFPIYKLYNKNMFICQTGRLLPQAPGLPIACHTPPPTQNKPFNKLVLYLFH